MPRSVNFFKPPPQFHRLVGFYLLFLFAWFIWLDSSKTIETIMSLKKALWKEFLFVLAVCLLSGLAGFFVLKSRIGLLLGVICAIVIAALVLLGIFMNERARAFQKNAMAKWLEKHPQGREVLDEFAV